MGPSTFQKLSVVCLLSTTVPTTSALAIALDAAQAIGLLPRAETCGGDSSLSHCGAGFPSSFCCPSDTTCTSIGNNSTNTVAETVICCPTGQNCQYIRPITCDLTQQDATAHPSNAIHTTNLTATLTTCGTQCCPLGYECENGLCSMTISSTVGSPDPSSSSSSSSSSASSSVPSSTSIAALPTAASSTAAASASSSSTATPATTDDNDKDDDGDSHTGATNKGAIAGGVIGGLAAGALLIGLVLWFMKRRRGGTVGSRSSFGGALSEKKKFSGDFGPVSRTVSDPIYNPSLSGRSEFLRRDAASPHAAPSIGTTMGLSSPFSLKEGNIYRKNTVAANSVQQTPHDHYGFGYSANVRAGPSPRPEMEKSPLAPLPRIKSLFSRSSLHLPRPRSSVYSRATAAPYTPTPGGGNATPGTGFVPPVPTIPEMPPQPIPPIRRFSAQRPSPSGSQPQRGASQRSDSSRARLNGPSTSSRHSNGHARSASAATATPSRRASGSVGGRSAGGRSAGGSRHSRSASASATTPNPNYTTYGSDSRPGTARTGSTETIDVLMPAPAATYYVSTPPSVAELNRPHGQDRDSLLAPPRAPFARAMPTANNGGNAGESSAAGGAYLGVPERRRPLTTQTTFSQLMENAGIPRNETGGGYGGYNAGYEASNLHPGVVNGVGGVGASGLHGPRSPPRPAPAAYGVDFKGKGRAAGEGRRRFL
ncbi:uncharacterized protein K452DRAFT_308827 [Aplosporella prunicola CBS 121167]|uniref:Mid2 domain-containing protein n=1 Tax=Aplosporella prunicola CBS 121167 TaxID=1176127 RepID=A0A6A6BCA6_9PEZI|nr:uncharacterized protein K452DRAFT_308827 [Aplosporella prunicola CBS 121167]KAF2141760.1 hypothetical protein K452DRAFT_308827 [Aplosporella prunicola CBS 121167]